MANSREDLQTYVYQLLSAARLLAVPLISITYEFTFCCHGRGRGFEPRVPAMDSKELRLCGDLR